MLYCFSSKDINKTINFFYQIKLIKEKYCVIYVKVKEEQSKHLICLDDDVSDVLKIKTTEG